MKSQKRYNRNLIQLFSILFTISMYNTGCSSVNWVARVDDTINNIYIVDINAKTSTKDNPVIIEMNAGTYQVSVIGKSEDGAYDAWKFWHLKGWINAYYYRSSEFSEIISGDGITYMTPSLALSNAVDSKFTLKNKGKVYFYFVDKPYWDNTGGISLRIAPTQTLKNN